MKRAETIYCPSCGNRETKDLGEIPASNTFAGRHLDRVLPGGNLCKCSSCHLAFRYPRPSKSELDKLYREGHSENWPDETNGRDDWNLTAKTLDRFPEIASVLDIGCYDGGLLYSLDQRFEKLGIEIHEEAAKRAESKDITIIAQDFVALDQFESIADAVIATDVIEHTEDPLKFLRTLAKATRPGGLIIVATGNSDAPTWRLMGSRYWYCYIAEHLSFINPAWCNESANRLKLDVVTVELFSHASGLNRLSRRMTETIFNLTYRSAPWLFKLLRKMGAGGVDVGRFPELGAVPPYWLTAKDHLFVAFRKSVNSNHD